MPRYTYRFAENDTHSPIRNLEELHRARWDAWLGLFCDGVKIGSARLENMNRKQKYVHTENVCLIKDFRRKGHGVFLYKALIQLARRLGAVRIYSSEHLNKHSRRMWRVKLPKIFDVQRTRQECSSPCRHCAQNESQRYYIQLNHSLKKKLDKPGK